MESVSRILAASPAKTISAITQWNSDIWLWYFCLFNRHKAYLFVHIRYIFVDVVVVFIHALHLVCQISSGTRLNVHERQCHQLFFE